MTHPSVASRATCRRYVLRDGAPDVEPRLGIVLGSGLGGLADTLGTEAVGVPNRGDPGLPAVDVAGYAGRFVLGRLLEGVPVAGTAGSIPPVRGTPAGSHQAPRPDVRGPRGRSPAPHERRRIPPRGGGSRQPHAHHRPPQPDVDEPARRPERRRVGRAFRGPRECLRPGELRARLLRIAGELRIHLHEGVYAAQPGPCSRRRPRSAPTGSCVPRRRDVTVPGGDRRPPCRPARRGDQRDHQPGRRDERRADRSRADAPRRRDGRRRPDPPGAASPSFAGGGPAGDPAVAAAEG